MVAARRWGRRNWVMLGVLVAAIILWTGAALEAAWLDPVFPPAELDRDWYVNATSPLERSAIPLTVVASGVSKDPFRPDRKRPPNRYRLPGDRSAGLQARASVPPSLARMRLLGTAVMPGRPDLAAFQVPGRQPRMLRVGQLLEGFELASVERGTATLVGPDTTLVLRLSGTR